MELRFTFFTYLFLKSAKAIPKWKESVSRSHFLSSAVVREEQRALPWPFVRPAGSPQSPPLLPSSPQSRSLSVGSSPCRAPLRPCRGPRDPLLPAQRQLQGKAHQVHLNHTSQPVTAYSSLNPAVCLQIFTLHPLGFFHLGLLLASTESICSVGMKAKRH